MTALWNKNVMTLHSEKEFSYYNFLLTVNGLIQDRYRKDIQQKRLEKERQIIPPPPKKNGSPPVALANFCFGQHGLKRSRKKPRSLPSLPGSSLPSSCISLYLSTSASVRPMFLPTLFPHCLHSEPPGWSPAGRGGGGT